MDKFTREELTAMGFEKTHVSRKESGDKAYDYYTFGRPHIDLISNCFEKGIEYKDGELLANTELFYENRKWYKKNIEDIYLKDELKIHMQFYYSDKETVIEGIESALWDCDFSHYKIGSLERQKVTNEIILVRDRG